MSAWTCHGFQPLFAHPDLNRPQKGMLGEVLKDQRPERTGLFLVLLPAPHLCNGLCRVKDFFYLYFFDLPTPNRANDCPGFGTASKKGVCRRRVACHGQRLACRCPWTHQSLSMASHTDNGQ
ncbi:unnamed protein product, partial [Mesorhabditis belari]|uniref:Uncharacterized protein n=1 Tax=Mesorhabditis belari TaxID=2138241 RepID=A0AAF3FA94_9BILA